MEEEVPAQTFQSKLDVNVAPFKGSFESLNNSNQRSSFSTGAEDSSEEDVLSLLNEVCTGGNLEESFSLVDEEADCLNTSTQSSSNSMLEEELEQAFHGKIGKKTPFAVSRFEPAEDCGCPEQFATSMAAFGFIY